MMAWHDAVPRAKDERRFSCVLGVRWEKASVARYGVDPDFYREEWNNGLLLLRVDRKWVPAYMPFR